MCGGNLVGDRFHADLELEKIESCGALGLRLGDVLLGCGIAQEPHRRDALTLRTGNKIDQPLAGRAARKVDRKLVQRGSLGPGARCGSRSFRRCHARPELLVLGGTCNKRGEVFLQSLDRDVFELLGKIARQAPRVLIGQEGQQEMPGTHPVLPVVDGSERPGLFEEPGESRRKGRGAGVPRLQPVEGARQIPRHAGRVYFEVAENPRQVGIRRLDQLEQQVLDFDVIMRARQTEARRSLQRAAACSVELGYQRFQVRSQSRILLNFVPMTSKIAVIVS